MHWYAIKINHTRMIIYSFISYFYRFPWSLVWNRTVAYFRNELRRSTHSQRNFHPPDLMWLTSQPSSGGHSSADSLLSFLFFVIIFFFFFFFIYALNFFDQIYPPLHTHNSSLFNFFFFFFLPFHFHLLSSNFHLFISAFFNIWDLFCDYGKMEKNYCCHLGKKKSFLHLV